MSPIFSFLFLYFVIFILSLCCYHYFFLFFHLFNKSVQKTRDTRIQSRYTHQLHLNPARPRPNPKPIFSTMVTNPKPLYITKPAQSRGGESIHRTRSNKHLGRTNNTTNTEGQTRHNTSNPATEIKHRHTRSHSHTQPYTHTHKTVTKTSHGRASTTTQIHAVHPHTTTRAPIHTVSHTRTESQRSKHQPQTEPGSRDIRGVFFFLDLDLGFSFDCMEILR